MPPLNAQPSNPLTPPGGVLKLDHGEAWRLEVVTTPRPSHPPATTLGRFQPPPPPPQVPAPSRDPSLHSHFAACRLATLIPSIVVLPRFRSFYSPVPSRPPSGLGAAATASPELYRDWSCSRGSRSLMFVNRSVTTGDKQRYRWQEPAPDAIDTERVISAS